MSVSPELLRRYDRPGPRYTSYPTALEFDDRFGANEYIPRLRRSAEANGALALYVHLPFCQERCLYCACNVVVSRNAQKVSRPYIDRVLREIALVTAELGTGRVVSQLHLGGGTPTYHDAASLGVLLDGIESRFDLSPTAERSIEVDPRVTTSEHLEMLAAHGFRRISLGVQDFDPKVQLAIGRVQSVEQTRRVVDEARSLGFTSVNLDLIYGLPHQTPETIRRTVADVVAMRPERLAVYSFAFLPGSRRHQNSLPVEAIPSGAEKLRLLIGLRSALAEAGYKDIGIDHFALPDDELCTAQAGGRLGRNFMGYAVEPAAEMVAFGTSGIGFVDGAYVQNHRKLADYRRSIDAGEIPIGRGYSTTADDRVRADVIRELMCNFVVDKARVESDHGVHFDSYFGASLDALAEPIRDGLVVNGHERLEATQSGRLLARNLAMCFDAHLGKGPKKTFSRTV